MLTSLMKEVVAVGLRLAATTSSRRISNLRQVSGIRCQVPGVRYQVPGIRCQVSGARYQVPGIRCQDCQVPGA